MNGIFETIEPQPDPGRWSRPQATMTAKGHIKISRVAFELLGEPTHVQVLFDSASQTIALKRADKHDTNTHPLLSHGVPGRHGGRLIKVYNLMERIEAELYTCMRFKDVRLDNYGRLVLELRKAVPGFNGQRIGVYKEWKDRRYSERNERRRDQRRLQREEKVAAEAKERETEILLEERRDQRREAALDQAGTGERNGSPGRNDLGASRSRRSAKPDGSGKKRKMTDADRRREAWRRGEGPTPSDIDIYTDFGRRPITPERAAEIAQVRKDYEERLRREAKERGGDPKLFV